MGWGDLLLCARALFALTFALETRSSHAQLADTIEYQKKNRKCFCCMICVLIVVILAITIGLSAFFGLKNTNAG